MFDDAPIDWAHSHDVLSALVSVVGMKGVVLSVLSLGAPWTITHPPSLDPVMHAVGSGLAYLRTPGSDAPVVLMPGDVALLPRGGRYRISDKPEVSLQQRVDVPNLHGRARCSIRAGGVGPRTEVTCCAFRFRDTTAAPLLGLLPEMVVLRGTTQTAAVQNYLTVLFDEARSNRAGTEGIVSRLAELLYLSALREQVEAADAHGRGVLAALAHPQLARALGLVHGALEQPWTVANVAAKVGMSRAAFAQLFAETTGCAPMRYIQRCRLEEAKRLLAHSQLGLAEIGRRVGYRDPAGFSRAFRRAVGTTPRAFRRGVTEVSDAV